VLSGGLSCLSRGNKHTQAYDGSQDPQHEATLSHKNGEGTEEGGGKSRDQPGCQSDYAQSDGPLARERKPRAEL